MDQGKIVSCRFDMDDYEWLQRVKAHLQKTSIGTVTDSSILRDLVKRARKSKAYGELGS